MFYFAGQVESFAYSHTSCRITLQSCKSRLQASLEPRPVRLGLHGSKVVILSIRGDISQIVVKSFALAYLIIGFRGHVNDRQGCRTRYYRSVLEKSLRKAVCNLSGLRWTQRSLNDASSND